MRRAIYMIEAERNRQVAVKGYDAVHDDEHDAGQIVHAAIAFAASSVGNHLLADQSYPWGLGFEARRDDTRLSLLSKAGALIVAEMERVQRVEQRDRGEQPQPDPQSAQPGETPTTERRQVAAPDTSKILRDTLVKIVGSDDPAELAAMRALLQEAKQAGGDVEPSIFDAIDVLIATGSAPAATPSSDEGAGYERVLTLLTDLVDAIEHADLGDIKDPTLDTWNLVNLRERLAAANKLLGRSVDG